MSPTHPRKLRVLFVGSFFDETKKSERGGMHTDCDTLVTSPIREMVDFITFDSTNSSVPPPAVSRRVLNAPRRAARFIRILFLRKPDATLIYSSGGLSFFEKAVMALLARTLGVPVLLSVRAGVFQDQFHSSWSFRVLARLLLRVPSAILCQSQSWAKFYVHSVGLRRSRLEVVHNWINLDRFPICEEVGVPRVGSPLRLLFVGWVNRSKGIFELLAAVREVASNCAVTLDIVGRGNDYEEAVALVSSDPILHPLIHFHGWLSANDVVARYREADVFVLPTYAEGFPNVVLEAMAMGLPVITTPVGGIPDVIEDGRNGILVPPRSTAALVRAVEYMADNHEKKLDFGRANRCQVVAQHGIQSLWPRMLLIFCSLARRNGPDVSA